MDQLGRAKSVKVQKENTIIVDGAGDKDAIQGRIKQIDVYKRQILYRAGTLGRRTDPCCDHTYKSRDGAVL